MPRYNIAHIREQGQFARQALLTAQLLRTEILGPIQRHQCPSGQPLKCLEAVALPQLFQNLVEAGL